MEKLDHRLPEHAIRNAIAAELSRREFMSGAGGLAAAVALAGAVPALARLAAPETAQAAQPTDGTMQAVFDTIIPGRKVDVTELGNPIDPAAILGVDPEPGAVEADALLLANHPKLGASSLVPPFIVDLQARAASEGGQFIDLDYEARQRVMVSGLAFSNSERLLWEAIAAVPFTAFCAAANTRNATDRTSVGYDVMGHPGVAPHGYRDFSYGRRLARERTEHGSLP